jgi:3-methylcrotonyl-CoA carboxylase alpha subunit
VALAAIAAAGLAGGGDEGFALWAPLEWQVPLRFGAETVTALLRITAPGVCEVAVGNATVVARRARGGWAVNGAVPQVVRTGDAIAVMGADPRAFHVVDPLQRVMAAGPAGDVVAAPMPGAVRAVSVAAGDAVAAGDRLCVLEAMKMEHALRAGRDGIVAEVMVATGDQVAAGAALIRLAPEGA